MGVIIRETVASGSWSSKVEDWVRSWRKSEGGVELWIACREMEGYGIERPACFEGEKRTSRLINHHQLSTPAVLLSSHIL